MFSQALLHLIINSCSGLTEQTFPTFSEEEAEMGAWARMGAWLPRKSVLTAPPGLTNAVSFRAGCLALRCDRTLTQYGHLGRCPTKSRGRVVGRGCQALSLHLHFSGLPPSKCRLHPPVHRKAACSRVTPRHSTALSFGWKPVS